MTIELTDDGTLDTVLRCSECGEEMRYNYGSSDWPDPGIDDAPTFSDAYDAFIAWAIEDATADHECPLDPDSEPSEPEEGDITTEDHETFYQYGNVVIENARGRNDFDASETWYLRINGRQITITAKTPEQAVRQYMERSQFWPNCWFISDHGNAHLMDLSEGK